jgi:KaiC/GvpD/RAD55 family RecA-like ATPase
MLGGGLVTGTTNYLEVERGAEELSFVAAFLNEGFRRRDVCGIRLYDLPPEQFFCRLAEHGVNTCEALDSGALVVADLWEEGEYDPERRGPILKTGNPSDSNSALRLYVDLLALAKKRLRNEESRGLRFVTYSASTAIMSFKFDAAYKMMRSTRAEIRTNKITNLSIINPSMFEPTVVAAFEDTSDSITTLSIRESRGRYQRFVRVKQSPNPNFQLDEVPYDIVDGKILLKLQ